MGPLIMPYVWKFRITWITTCLLIASIMSREPLTDTFLFTWPWKAHTGTFTMFWASAGLPAPAIQQRNGSGKHVRTISDRSSSSVATNNTASVRKSSMTKPYRPVYIILLLAVIKKKSYIL